MGLIKIKGYQIFEKVRSGPGGGLLTAVDEDLLPVLISTGEEEETEIMTVQVKLGNYDVRIINAYGPQEDDSNLKRFNFWEEVENEIISAKENHCLIILQMDANAKVGKDEISDDPHEVSNNGKIMLEMVERQGLIIANTLDKCKGTITRERRNGVHVEKSILDYIILCDGMKEFLENMLVDEQRIHVLTKYAGKKGKKKKTVSDHNVLVANFTLKFNRFMPKIRREFFNFKNKDDQKTFLEETSTSEKLLSSFSSERSFPHNASIFFKNLKATFQTSFKKIRISSGNNYKHGEKTLQGMLKLKTELNIFILNNKCLIAKKIAEKNLTENFAAKSAEIIKEQVKEIETLEGNFSQVGFWKIRKKLCPQAPDPPMAKINEDGMLVTAPNLLKNLYLKTYTHRLRQREMKAEYLDVFFLKTELWESRCKELISRKSEPWSLEDLVKVLKSLKNNKTMDPHGMINEIFKPGCIGKDLKATLLSLFNGIKSHLFVPEYMTFGNINK